MATAPPTLLAVSFHILLTTIIVFVYGEPTSLDADMRGNIGLNTLLIALASNMLLPTFD